jgi:asparagine synthase (glutamine-hydrolysing)
MCGILGTRRSRPIRADVFGRMLDALAHRGPDGAGIEVLDQGQVVFGHRRLAIIDLSANAAQPMTNEDGSVWLTFNGEIYNYRDLRCRLQTAGHRFRTNGDSEVIIHAYEEWGESCVERFRGIFAFGIWDKKAEKLFLARDHLGVKPLNYTTSPDAFTFASEPAAIVEDPDFHREINFDSLRDFLAFGYVTGERCIFRGIHRLPPGHTATLVGSDLRVHRYWRLEYQPIVTDFAAAARLLDEKLNEAIGLQLVSDVPLGTFLSGGIDSSLVTALATREYSGKLRTFTIGFDDAAYDERPYARRIAAACGTDHREKVASRGGIDGILLDSIDAFDEPFEPNGPIPAYLVSGLAKECRTKAVLGGDGGDELFAGYLWYDRLAHRLRPTGQWNLALSLVDRRRCVPHGTLSRRDYEAFYGYGGALSWAVQSELLTNDARNEVSTPFLAAYEPFARTDLPAVTAAQYLDTHVYLPDHVLCKIDRASMANGVEVRVPFLDPELVELAFRVSTDLHYKGGERKAVLKRVAASYLPREVVTSRKKGFSSPMMRWTDPSLRDWCAGLLNNGYLVTHGILRRSWNETLASSEGQAGVRGLWLLTTAELWARRWLAREDRRELPSLSATRL